MGAGGSGYLRTPVFATSLLHFAVLLFTVGSKVTLNCVTKMYCLFVPCLDLIWA